MVTAAGLGALAACGGAADAPATDAVAAPVAAESIAAAPPPAGDDRPVVLFIGTSLTAGLGLDPDDAYPAVLQRMADSAGFSVRVMNAGLSGETSAGALRRAEWLLERPAAVVVIETGANDGLRGVDPDSTAATVRALITAVRARQPAARVALVAMEAPTNLGAEYTARFRAIFPRVAREAGVTLLPFLLDGVAGVPTLNQADGIHPTEEGARRAAANLWPALVPLLPGPGGGPVG